jgi:hypothetical protein
LVEHEVVAVRIVEIGHEAPFAGPPPDEDNAAGLQDLAKCIDIVHEKDNIGRVVTPATESNAVVRGWMERENNKAGIKLYRIFVGFQNS